jgi:hypothetical protein
MDVFALTHDGAAWHNIDLGHSALAERVARFRGGLDPRMLLDERALAERNIKRELFDLGAAHETRPPKSSTSSTGRSTRDWRVLSSRRGLLTWAR